MNIHDFKVLVVMNGSGSLCALTELCCGEVLRGEDCKGMAWGCGIMLMDRGLLGALVDILKVLWRLSYSLSSYVWNTYYVSDTVQNVEHVQ